MQRRLTTILAADIATFSRLVELDEEGVIAAQRAHRAELIDPLIERHGGRIANTAGDSLLIEFPSAVEAVRCAIAMQEGMAIRNADIADNRRISYRIGINVGDVIAEGDDLLGDGVNVAARLEALANPGGVVLSRTVRDQVRDRLELNLADLGEIKVKNIARRVRAFQVLNKGQTAMRPPGHAKRRMPVLALMAALIAITIGGVLYWQFRYAGSVDNGSRGAISTLSDKPSIAVLPFVNLSGDDSQVYFADGMAEDIITDLSKVSGLFVIARNSSFAYRGRNVDIKDLGRELGVRYILEGSVQRSGNQVRVNAQLIDTQTGGHLWAERIDGQTADVFKLQDQVTRRIVDALEIELTSAEQLRRAGDSQVDPKAYDLYLQGLKLHATFRESDLPEMLQLYGHAVKLDPDFAEAHARLANVAYDIARLGKFWMVPQPQALEMTETHLTQALELEPDNVMALSTLAHQELEAGHADKAEEIIERATAIAPSDIDAVVRRAYILSRSGRYADAAATADLAQRLEPKPTAAQLMILSNVYFHARRYEKSIELGERAKELGIRPLWALETLVADYARLGMQEELDRAMAEFKAIWPNVNLRRYRNQFEYFRPKGTLDHWIESLRLAGIPEWPGGMEPTRESMLTVDEVTSIFDSDVQRIGATLEGWRFRSVSNPDGGIKVELRIPNGQQVEFVEYPTRLVATQDGRLVQEKCTRDPNRNMGRERCSLILRNARGSKVGRDEYMAVSDRTIARFAVFPRGEKVDWTKSD